jgi:hypothetical protein
LYAQSLTPFLPPPSSLLLSFSLFLSLSLTQMPLPSRNQLGLLVHGFQMFSRDEWGSNFAVTWTLLWEYCYFP